MVQFVLSWSWLPPCFCADAWADDNALRVSRSDSDGKHDVEAVAGGSGAVNQVHHV